MDKEICKKRILSYIREHGCTRPLSLVELQSQLEELGKNHCALQELVADEVM